MRLFIVTSVYQFMNALTVQMNDPSVSSDILCATKLLDDTFDLEKLKDENIFDGVFCWTGEIDGFKTVSRTRAEKIKNIFKKVGLAANKRRLLSDFPRIDKQYDEICIGYPDFPTRLACQTLKNKATVRTILEEGMYTYDFLAKKESLLKRTAFKLFIGEEVVSRCEKVYVYRPDMLKLGVKEMKVVPIYPRLDTLGPIIKRIYKHELPCIDEIDKPVIMFDQDMQDNEITQRQCNIAELLARTFGKESFVVKMHPRTVNVPYSENVPVYRARCPFEILMSTIDLESKILVSLISTASMNPKMMLDAEPTVIFTTKIVIDKKTEQEWNESLAIVNRLKANYRNPEKIFIAESMEELEAIVSDLKQKQAEQNKA